MGKKKYYIIMQYARVSVSALPDEDFAELNESLYNRLQ
jgi:hypothetical protein